MCLPDELFRLERLSSCLWKGMFIFPRPSHTKINFVYFYGLEQFKASIMLSIKVLVQMINICKTILIWMVANAIGMQLYALVAVAKI